MLQGGLSKKTENASLNLSIVRILERRMHKNMWHCIRSIRWIVGKPKQMQCRPNQLVRLCEDRWIKHMWQCLRSIRWIVGKPMKIHGKPNPLVGLFKDWCIQTMWTCIRSIRWTVGKSITCIAEPIIVQIISRRLHITKQVKIHWHRFSVQWI